MISWLLSLWVALELWKSLRWFLFSDSRCDCLSDSQIDFALCVVINNSVLHIFALFIFNFVFFFSFCFFTHDYCCFALSTANQYKNKHINTHTPWTEFWVDRILYNEYIYSCVCNNEVLFVFFFACFFSFSLLVFMWFIGAS